MSAIDKIDLPFLAPFSALDLRPWYWFALALVALVLIVNFRLRGSRWGRAWLAMRDDEERRGAQRRPARAHQARSPTASAPRSAASPAPSWRPT